MESKKACRQLPAMRGCGSQRDGTQQWHKRATLQQLLGWALDTAPVYINAAASR
jgi:hypothetical protein